MEHDYRAIENLLYRYAEHIDNGDLEGVAGLFSKGRITAAVMPEPAVGEAAVLSMYRGSTRLYPDDGTPHTQHVVSNPIIELEPGATTARCRSRFTVLQAVAGLPLQVIIAGRYHDRFQKIDGHWYFAEREMITGLLGDLSQHLLFPTDDLQA